MQYTHCFFDLDGTVVNSEEGVLNGVRYALDKMGWSLSDDTDPALFIGPPLPTAFTNVCGMSREDSLKTLGFYRDYYRKTGIYECKVYNGVEKLLRDLQKADIICALATCKPHRFATDILEHFGLSKYFSFVSGPEFDGTRKEKNEVIAYAMEQLQVDSPARVLMIGDRANDVLGAQKNGIDCAGALWGFGTADELTSAGAIAVFETPEEIRTYLGISES